MDLYLQFGHGMKQIAIDLSREWKGTTVILSPRDISPEQLRTWKGGFDKAGVKTLFDPQFYYPKSNHPGLLKYKYWDASFGTKLEGNNTFEEELIQAILEYNDIAGCNSFIIPSAMYEYDEGWINRWRKQCEKLINATKKYVIGKRYILTLAFPENLLLQKEMEIERIIEEIEKYEVDGFYIVAYQPQKKYLVDTPMWLSNLLQICAAIKLSGKKVIMGYGNHQLLCLSAAGVDGMATGTYLNVRHFFNKFEKDDVIQRKSIWYYYPAAMSEYKMGFLDVAYNAGVLQQMKPTKDMDKGFVDLLFAGALPSATAFNETMAFKHYIHCVKIQVQNVSRETYQDTVAANEVMLEMAMRRIEYMEKNGVYAQARSFKDIVDVNRAALQRLDKVRGFQLKHEWKDL
ncbi:hypothetical protein D7X88_11480 [bacterium C-53]|nr:hypothetical protein [Lachnospiraceae bacterium]NBI03658.1 hypothetical protein [Lachnospiraceae bacterium]RKJ09420.1 hypothetical protein D7X88_11480 [bacterium C-53]